MTEKELTFEKAIFIHISAFCSYFSHKQNQFWAFVLVGMDGAVWESKEDVLFTILSRGQFGNSWKPWKGRGLRFQSDGTLIVSKGQTVKLRIDLSRVCITRMGLAGETAINSVVLCEREVGLHVVCHVGESEVIWRCSLPESLEKSFLAAVKSTAVVHNVDQIEHESFRAISSELTLSLVEAGGSSVMRRAVARAMDKYDARSRNQQIVARRGALKFLPVFFANDLVHGSWWFVAGSIYVVISSSVVLANGFDMAHFLGDDSTGLSEFHYRATWFLILLSGVMFTLGSLAFVRAMHDPPIAPWLPKWHHFQNDELIGSWLFFLGVMPLPFYCFIFLVEAGSNSLRLLYLIGIFFSALLLVGAFLFVRACYPTIEGQTKRCSLPPGLWVTTARWCVAPCLCIREKHVGFHLANDWLAGCWLLLWITLVLTLGCFVLMVDAINQRNALLTFIYATSWTENIMFTLGCAYFVSGSYPAGGPPDEIDDGADTSYLPLHTQHGHATLSSSSVPGALPPS